MDEVIQKLEEIYTKHPESSTIRDTLTHLSKSQSSLNGQTPQSSWDLLKHSFETLQSDGLWEGSPENDRLLQQLQAQLRNGFQRSHSPNPSSPQDSMNSQWAPLPASPLRKLFGTSTFLPRELLELLNHTYFLHLLATDPRSVLPPGKSLLSVMSRVGSLEDGIENPPLHTQVEDMVHKAFWGEALECLSSPTPSVQIPRLKRLYEDIHIVLVSLLPPGHPVLVTLSSPLSPTSSPLRSAVVHLREIIQCLAERCAPARDEIVNSLMLRLDDIPTIELPHVVVETVQGILKFAEVMKEDLSQFVLGNMTESQLQRAVREQAQERDRELVMKMWFPQDISALWQEWVNAADPGPPLLGVAYSQDRKWIVRLVQALDSIAVVSCEVPVESPNTSRATPPPSPPNSLPPPFFFLAPTLLNIQNYIQGLVIAATLRSLVRLPTPSSALLPFGPSSADVTSASPAEDFMRRIWSLITDEIDLESGETKLINLADEVIRVRRLVGGSIHEEEEKRLRAAVDRTLQPGDHVFQLLQKRLVRALAERLLSATSDEDPLYPNHHHTVPIQLQSGRGPRNGKKSEFRFGLPGAETRKQPAKRPETPVAIKGFEDPVLITAVTREIERLRRCTEWVNEVWHDIVSSDI